jgi:hypothetical protein
MFANCAASTDIRAFEKALRPILPHSKSRIHSIAFTPSAEGLRIEVRTDSCTGSSLLPSKGQWTRRVVTEGSTLARLHGRLGQGELKITYADGRLFLNALSVLATRSLRRRARNRAARRAG